MTLVLATPGLNDTRSALADWMELQAITQPRGLATPATLSTFLDIVSDGASEHDDVFDTEAQELLDNDIIEESRSDIIQSTFEELEYRQTLLGESYPFQVSDRGTRLELLPGDPVEHAGKAV